MGMESRPLSPEEMRDLLQAEIDAGNPGTWAGDGATRQGLTGTASTEDLSEQFGVPLTPRHAPAQAVAYTPVPSQPYLPTPPRGMSVASMVLGLVSIAFGFTFILPVVSLILGIVGIRREPAGRGMAITGVILSGLILAVWVLIIGAILVGGLLVAGSAASYDLNH